MAWLKHQTTEAHCRLFWWFDEISSLNWRILWGKRASKLVSEINKPNQHWVSGWHPWGISDVDKAEQFEIKFNWRRADHHRYSLGETVAAEQQTPPGQLMAFHVYEWRMFEGNSVALIHRPGFLASEIYLTLPGRFICHLGTKLRGKQPRSQIPEKLEKLRDKTCDDVSRLVYSREEVGGGVKWAERRKIFALKSNYTRGLSISDSHSHGGYEAYLKAKVPYKILSFRPGFAQLLITKKKKSLETRNSQ